MKPFGQAVHNRYICRMNLYIKQAGLSDIPDVTLLNAQVQELHATLYPTAFVFPAPPGEVSRFFAGVLQQDQHRILIANVDGRVVAYLWYEMRGVRGAPFRPARSQIYVHQLTVDKNRRREGIASQLMRTIDAICDQDGIDDVALDTWSTNKDAQAFFAYLGFKPERVILRKEITENALAANKLRR